MARDLRTQERDPPRGRTAAAAETRDWRGRWRKLHDVLHRAAIDSADVATPRAERLRLISEAVLGFYRAFASREQGSTAYRLCFRAIGELCAEPSFQELWREECFLVRRFLSELPLRGRDPARILRDYIRSIVWQYIWGNDLNRLTKSDFGQLLRVHGEEHLGPEWRSTGIVFVHWLTPFAEVFGTWLAHETLGCGILIGRPRANLMDRNRADHPELGQAQDALSQGGHVHISPDAYFGHCGLGFPFLGRVRDFQSTFAQLALRTGARVHPASVHLDGSGGVVVRFGAGFGAAAPQKGDSSSFVQSLVGVYVEHLAREWTARPADVMQRQMLKFLTLPRAGISETAASAQSDPRIVICLGLYSSGSTWVFNVVREIWLAEVDAATTASAFKSLCLDTEAELPLDTFEARRITLKTHIPSDMSSDELLRLIAVCRGPVILTVRDPRDAIVSAMRRFRVSFDVALGAIALNAQAILQLAGLREVSVLRYEDGAIGSPGIFDHITSLLGATLRPGLREKILSSLAPDAVRSTIDRLCASGVITNARPWDPETHWHFDHIGDGRVGKYVGELSHAQQSLVKSRTAAFCKRFGYEAENAQPLRLAVLTDLAFWEGGSLFAEWVRQWIERIARVLPIIVLYLGESTLESNRVPDALEVIRIARGKREMSRVLSRYELLGAMFALADAETGRACRRVFKEAVAGAALPAFDFVARNDGAPNLGLARSDIPSEVSPLAPMRYLPDHRNAAPAMLDRSKLCVITREPAEEWNALALAYLRELGEARGITLLLTVCGPRAEHSPEFFRQTVGRMVHPTVFIGQSCVAWMFCRHLLTLAGIPHLYLAADCIAPLVRSETGAPSLVRSIRRFLEDAPAPRAVIPVPDAGWDGLRAALVPA
jgi:hypothetical protein